MESLLLIDGMSNAYRAFYAIRGLATSRGRPTNAVFGFIKILLKIIGEYQPDYLAIAGDARGPTLRHEEYEDYKAQRKPIPDELAEQLPLIRRAARGYNIPWLEVPGYEADDILAALAVQGRQKGFQTYILTGDKDMLQLVNDTVKVINPHGNGQLFDRKAVEERYGVPPSGIGDVLALMGDSIDNVPGVPGIGEKTAVRLLQEYGSLEEVLAHAGEVKNKRAREGLLGHGEQARFSRSLVELKTEVPLEIGWEELRRREPDREELCRLFEELEFRQLLDQFLPDAQTPVPVKVISEVESCRALAGELSGKKEFALLPRPDSPGFLNTRLEGLALCAGEEPVFIDLAPGDSREEMLEILRPLLEGGGPRLVTHDGKLLIHLLLNEGIEPSEIPWDSLLASYLIQPSRPESDLAGLSRSLLGRADIPPAGKSPSREEEIGRLGAEAAVLSSLIPVLEKELESRGLAGLMTEMELPLSRVLVTMERDGIRLDPDQLRAFSRSLEEELESLTARMYKMAGEEFNLNSPRQLQKILFEKLELPPQKKIKTGYSTDVSVLEKLSGLHPLPQLLLEYRGLFKLKTTYLDPLPELIDPGTGRIHTTFHQAVTATGRLSSSDPNLQNIPIRGEMGKKVRRAFLPGPDGWRFLAADYSQIDLRVLAHLSRDQLLLEAFREDRDIHAFTATQIFNVDLEQVTPEMRRRAKTVNFGIIYGMGAYGLSRDLKISFAEADRFIKQYFEKYRGVAEFIQKTIAEARRRGYVTTIYNRRRYLPELSSEQESVRRFGERTAVNTPIQGSSSDIIKLAMIEIADSLRREGLRGRLILQVHDDLLFETPPEELDALARLVRRAMEDAGGLDVPLRIDLKTGDNWGDLENWEPRSE